MNTEHENHTEAPAAAPMPLSINEAKLLLSELNRDGRAASLRDVVALVATTGIRGGELCKLRWSAVDFARRKIVVESKAGSTRWIPFGPKLADLLKAWKDRNPNEEFVLGICPPCIMRKVSLKLAKISNTHFNKRSMNLHLLRHSYISWLLYYGCEALTVMQLAGYSSWQSCIRVLGDRSALSQTTTAPQRSLEDELLGD